MDKQYPHGNRSQRVNIDVIGGNDGICKTGVPFPVGQLTSLQQLQLLQAGTPVPCYARPLCHWPDGSIKWIHISFFHSAQRSSQYALAISETRNSKHTEHEQPGLELHSTDTALTVTTSTHHYTLDLRSLSFTAQSMLVQNERKKDLLRIGSLSSVIAPKDGERITGKLERWQSRISHNVNDATIGVIEIELEGAFEYPAEKSPLRFKTIIEWYQPIPTVKIHTTLHNPNPASHPNGLWDLGDEGSVYFNSQYIDLEILDQGSIHYRTSPEAQWQPSATTTRIIQYASGGKHWQSPVHVDRYNEIPISKNGFEVFSDDVPVSNGERALPIVYSDRGIGLTIEKFWQNFPSSISIEGHHLALGLFPSIPNLEYELQGGEQKTHTFWLSFANETSTLDWVHSPPIAKPDITWLAQCCALPLFVPASQIDPIQNLVIAGLEDGQNFFAKREAIDEYGWRHFGDLYADHETAGYNGNDIFASHYNNQYDPVYGFLKQFLLTSNVRWFELADDLAKHVKDIDIYHTTRDKAEYNGGLFWHTDHYVKAYTSTHRTFSRHQVSNAYEDRAGGGGPGGQHCYTTGLTYHYLMTGAEDSKQAVLDLTNWITHVYEGTNTCLEILLALKNRNMPGIKNQISGQYPLDRGTAYYIIALLDSHLLTQQPEYLHRVEHIIHNTVHPTDDISSRNLLDADKSWFYTVFLQALCRYLQVKQEVDDLDNAFYYARDTLLHYADWMLDNEYPYLEKPELLEFPNETWTAQDLRKTHVLAAAYYYSNKTNAVYLEKAKYFYDYVVSRLSSSPERVYTRVLALLMLNQGALEYYSTQTNKKHFAERRQQWQKADYQRNSGLVFNLTKTLAHRLAKFSVTNEIKWLKTRVR